ncbi:serine protease snake-like [Drosophila kikkawai]|uniref:Serine protease snake-like n=1 Tax=Drosophila kikkawai TaxID=30033 RepID=A0ABM3C690_DROKI
MVQGYNAFPNCKGRCVPELDCKDFETSYTPPMCNKTHVCCPRPTVRTYTSKSAIACLNWSNNRELCPPHKLIVDATVANKNEFPYMASVGWYNEALKEMNWTCGGALIHKKYVLTAAHCIQFQRENGTKEPDFFVRLGAHSLTDGIVYKVVDVKYPPDRDVWTKTGDISLLLLNDSVVFNEKIKPACLSNCSVKIGDNATVSGWGAVNHEPRMSKELNKLTLPILKISDCPRGLPGRHICSVGLTCKGDSGGPLARWHSEWGSCLGQVIGVVSYGDLCTAENPHSVYTDVYTYLDWIEKVVWP